MKFLKCHAIPALYLALAATYLCPPAVFAQAAQQPGAVGARDLFITAGKSVVIDSPVEIERVSVANPKAAEAVVVSTREIVVNGLAPSETSLIVWQKGGNRLLFDLKIQPSTVRLESVRRQLREELKDQEIRIQLDQDAVFVQGTAKDLTSAERAVAIAGTLGKVVNLLNVVGAAHRIADSAESPFCERGPRRCFRVGRQPLDYGKHHWQDHHGAVLSAQCKGSRQAGLHFE